LIPLWGRRVLGRMKIMGTMGKRIEKEPDLPKWQAGRDFCQNGRRKFSLFMLDIQDTYGKMSI